MSDQKCTSYEVTIPFKDGKTRVLRLYQVDDLKLACEKIRSIEGKEIKFDLHGELGKAFKAVMKEEKFFKNL